MRELLNLPPELHQHSATPARVHRFAGDRETGFRVGGDSARVFWVRVRAHNGRAFCEKLLYMLSYKRGPVAAAEHVRLPDIRVNTAAPAGR